MDIGLIDVDHETLPLKFPNIPLMKISAYHKSIGDNVEFYSPMFSGKKDIVYMSKVFSFTEDYQYNVNADKIIKGGTGYCINLVDGKEVFDKSKNNNLPEEIEHIYPDYSLYPSLTKDTAYGFMTRGCPRGCKFCIVECKEGRESVKVANLDEFWRGQKNIELCDPNIIACKEWKELLQQLIDSKACVNINQGIDVRIMTEEKAEMIKKIKIKTVHFAWDNYKDKEIIIPKLKYFKEVTGWDKRKLIVYVLCNFDTTIEQDLERIYTLKELGYWPYVMIYNKEQTKKGSDIRKMARWVNNRFIWEKIDRFEEYKKAR